MGGRNSMAPVNFQRAAFGTHEFFMSMHCDQRKVYAVYVVALKTQTLT